jgi:hypothetical protein
MSLDIAAGVLTKTRVEAAARRASVQALALSRPVDSSKMKALLTGDADNKVLGARPSFHRGKPTGDAASLTRPMTDSVVLGEEALQFKTMSQVTHGELGTAAFDRPARPLYKRVDNSRATSAANKGSKMRVIMTDSGNAAEDTADDATLPAGSAIRPWTDKRMIKATELVCMFCRALLYSCLVALSL